MPSIVNRCHLGSSLVFVSLALFFTAPGCAKWKAARLAKKKGPTPTAEQLIEKSKSYSASVNSLIGEAKVDYFDRNAGAGGRVKGKAIFLIERERNLRFDVLTPFDSPIATMASDGECLSLLDLSQKVFFQGEPSAENIGKLFQLPIDDQDIVRALLGEVPVMQAPEKSQVSFVKGEWVLFLAKGQEAQELHFDSQSYQLLSSSLTQDGTMKFKISYESYEEVEGTKAVLPRLIFFEKPSEKSDLKVRIIGDLDINKPIATESLRLTPPNGVQIVGECP